MFQKTELYLFDLGGILIELDGTPLPGSHMEATEWLSSSIAKDFERGFISKQEFAENFRETLRIKESTEDIITHFRSWPKGFYPGSTDLLGQLSNVYRVAALSNTNEIHWPKITDEFGAYRYFETIIASHKVGMAKPDSSIYRYALQELDVSPEKVVFIDDNAANVATAKALGINAYLAKGFPEVRRLIETLELINGH
ncbi:HAD family phosphatase [Microbulbifer sp.]|uniref:HAD family hydrolase n=1 Tax=Microbulbifer sp. TaxID=1908541 RepID=UPI00258F11EA|nr:HAD family phosphatase [Microbulbifer sp.]